MNEPFSAHDAKGRAEINKRIATMDQRIAEKDYPAIFMQGGCCIFALVLHENLQLPLFYSCPEDLDAVQHAFIMKQEMCLDFNGWRPISVIAKTYAGWPNIPSRPLSEARAREAIKRKYFGSAREKQLFQLARESFDQNRAFYRERD